MDDSCSCTGGSVVKPLRHLARRGGGAAKYVPVGAASHTDGELHDDGPQGGNQPLLWWGR
jgi:hypothetical protein